jgi:hypothetical protein
MKRFLLILVSLIAGLLLTAQLSAQCVPDTANCEDIGDPGQFCPLDLPRAGLNVLYDETVTVIPPGAFVFEGIQLNILHIKIDSVKNMPPGIDYYPNADILFPDTAYCIQLTGTPTEIGVDTLAIYITALVDILGGIEYQVVDDSSVVITVVEGLGIEPDKITEFQVFHNVPNPFSEVTRLSYYTPIQGKVELSIYNILGVLVHQETELAAPGKHHFNFNGSELQPGTYLYRVETGEDYFSGKFMKSR